LIHLLNNSIGIKELVSKKSGHSHTFTHLNDAEFDKFSEMENSISIKPKATKFRHSKSPSKERNHV